MNNFKSMTSDIMPLKYSLSQEFPCNTGKHYAICVIALCSSHFFNWKGSGGRIILETDYSEENWRNVLVTYSCWNTLDFILWASVNVPGQLPFTSNLGTQEDARRLRNTSLYWETSVKEKGIRNHCHSGYVKSNF